VAFRGAWLGSARSSFLHKITNHALRESNTSNVRAGVCACRDTKCRRCVRIRSSNEPFKFRDPKCRRCVRIRKAKDATITGPTVSKSQRKLYAFSQGRKRDLACALIPSKSDPNARNNQKQSLSAGVRVPVAPMCNTPSSSILGHSSRHF
jgi:hypothetical protein